MHSHTPPVGDASSPSTQPSLHITDQRNISYFQPELITPPFHNTIPQQHTITTLQHAASTITNTLPYSSSIPITTAASPRRKASQPKSYEQNATAIPILYEQQQHHSETNADLSSSVSKSSNRPSSYLPVPRGLTPLSMNFVYNRERGTSSTPSAVYSYNNGSSRPGFNAMPSSELMHASQENGGHHYDDEKEEENEHQQNHQEIVLTSPFQNVVYSHDGEENTNASPRHRKNSDKRRPLNIISPHWEQSVSNRSTSPQSMDLNFSYPTQVMRSDATHSQAHAHGHSRSHGHIKSGSKISNNASSSSVRHLRNRSNGTIITYASSSYTTLSNTTARIQPVAFNDSPRSSFSAINITTPTATTHEHHHRPQAIFGTTGMLEGAARTGKTAKTSNAAYDTSIYQLRNNEEEQSMAISSGYTFPTVSNTTTTNHGIGIELAISDPAEAFTATSETLSSIKKQGRRASGKLPDMLFSRTPSQSQEGGSEGGGNAITSSPMTASCSSKTSSSGAFLVANEQDLGASTMANDDNESVLDPMDDVTTRQHQHLYADIRLSSTSSLGGGIADEMLKEKEEHHHHRLSRPRLDESNPSASSSLMASTSSSSTHTSYYGLAV